MKSLAYLEKNLPPYLQHDLDSYIRGVSENSSLWDCLWGELYGSINGAYYDGLITAEHAHYLRAKYLIDYSGDDLL